MSDDIMKWKQHMTDRPHGYLTDSALAALQTASTATLTTQLLRRGFRNTFLAGLTPLRPDLRLVGYAYTLRYVPMREDLTIDKPVDNRTNPQRLAVEDVGAGDVLVIDARGDAGAATLGNILAERMMKRGAAGIVTDGAFRDWPEFRTMDIPSYAKAPHAAVSHLRHHAADRNVPIGCAGVLVMPGDVVVGDAEGVAVIPAHVAEEVALAAAEQEALEAFLLEKVRAGASILTAYPPDAATREEFERSRRE
jgi:regulator of RNase E activity RraA